MSTATSEDFVNAWRDGLNRSMAMLSMQTEVAEKLVAANVSAMKAAVDAETNSSGTAADKGADAMAASCSIGQAALESALECPAYMGQIASEMARDCSRLAIKYANTWAEHQIGLLDRMAASAPPHLAVGLRTMREAVKNSASAQIGL